MPSEISCFSWLMSSTMHVDLVVDVHQFARMADPLGPRHFADVHQALDAVFELHEGAVAHHVDDRALDASSRPGTSLATLSHGLALFCLRPRAIFSFSQSMCRIITSISSSILHHLGRMIDAAPAHVGDVQQAVDAAQVDERAEVGDVLDDALAQLADFQLLEQLATSSAPVRLRSGCGG